MIKRFSILLPCVMALMYASVANADIVTYVDAVWGAGTAGANGETTLANGTALNLVATAGDRVNPEDYIVRNNFTPNDNFWHDRTRGAANGGSVLVAGLGGATGRATLATTITGLTAGATYTTYGYHFGNGTNWDISLGTSAGALSTFADGAGTLASTNQFSNAIQTNDNGLLLREANLGQLVADVNGEITVFVAAGPSNERTWFDGVGFSLVAPPAVPEPSSLALLGALGLGLFVRRRKS